MQRGLHCKKLTCARRHSRTHNNYAADEAIEQSERISEVKTRGTCTMGTDFPRINKHLQRDDVSFIGGSISGMGAEAVIPAQPVPISYESIFLWRKREKEGYRSCYRY